MPFDDDDDDDNDDEFMMHSTIAVADVSLVGHLVRYPMQ